MAPFQGWAGGETGEPRFPHRQPHRDVVSVPWVSSELTWFFLQGRHPNADSLWSCSSPQCPSSLNTHHPVVEDLAGTLTSSSQPHLAPAPELCQQSPSAQMATLGGAPARGLAILCSAPFLHTQDSLKLSDGPVTQCLLERDENQFQLTRILGKRGNPGYHHHHTFSRVLSLSTSDRVMSSPPTLSKVEGTGPLQESWPPSKVSSSYLVCGGKVSKRNSEGSLTVRMEVVAEYNSPCSSDLWNLRLLF